MPSLPNPLSLRTCGVSGFEATAHPAGSKDERWWVRKRHFIKELNLFPTIFRKASSKQSERGRWSATQKPLAFNQVLSRRSKLFLQDREEVSQGFRCARSGTGWTLKDLNEGE